jgi:hypothetical protein
VYYTFEQENTMLRIIIVMGGSFCLATAFVCWCIFRSNTLREEAAEKVFGNSESEKEDV